MQVFERNQQHFSHLIAVGGRYDLINVVISLSETRRAVASSALKVRDTRLMAL